MCIAYITIKYKQYIIACYVDNNKISNNDEELNTKVIEKIVEHYGNISVSRGKKHKLLVTDEDFNH